MARVFHWKHGWIPLDGTALREVAAKHAAATISKVGGYQGRSEWGIPFQHTEEKVDGAPHVRVVTEKAIDSNFAIQAVDGYADDFTQAQKAEIAGYAEDIFKRLPGLHNGLDQEVQAVGANDDFWASTEAQSRKHKIGFSKTLWNGERVNGQIGMWKTDHGALGGQATSVKDFRRRTAIHEMGHVVHLRAQDAARRFSADSLNAPYRAVDEFVNERVTPRQMGFTYVAPDTSEDSLDRPVPRWQADSLNKKSAYATSSPYEFYAEAFLDGYVNGDKASESGKRAYAIAQKLFGPTTKAAT